MRSRPRTPTPALGSRARYLLVVAVVVWAALCSVSIASAQTRFSANEAQAFAARASELEAKAEAASGDAALALYEEALASYEEATEADDSLLGAWARTGVVLYILGRSEEAVDRLQPIAQRNSGSIELAHALGINLYAVGREDEARTALERVVANRDDLADAHFILGKYHLERESWTQAEPYFARYRELQPDDLQGLRALATIYVQTGAWDPALEVLERALELEPDDVTALIKLGHVHFEDSRYDEAAVAYRRAVELAPSRNDVRYDLASVHVIAGRCAEAVPIFDEVVAANDDHFGALYFRAECRRRMGELDRAEAEFGYILERKPDYWYGYLKLGEIAVSRGDLDAAQGHLDRSGFAESTNADELELAGRILHALGRSDEAIGLYTRLVDLEPDVAAHRVQLGRAYMRAGDAANAVEAFQEGADRDPTDQTAWAGLSTSLLAASAGALADEDRTGAVRYLDRAARLEIHPGEVALNRAILALRGDAASEARQHLDEARQVLPEHPMIARLDGGLALRDGRFGEAIELLEPLAEAGRLPEEALEDLALAYAGEGDWDAAHDTLERAPEPSPKNRALVAYRLGLSHAEDGRWRRAEKYLDEADALAEHLDRNERIRLELALGITALRTGQWSRAAKALSGVRTSVDALSNKQRRSIARGGANVDLELAYARYRSDDLDGAKSLLPRKPSGDAARLAEAVRTALAFAAYQAGDVPKARDNLDALDAKQRSTQLLRAAVLYQDGSTTEAGQIYEKLASDGEVEAMLGYALYLHDVADKPMRAMTWYQRYVDANGQRAAEVRERLEVLQRIYGSGEGS